MLENDHRFFFFDPGGIRGVWPLPVKGVYDNVARSVTDLLAHAVNPEQNLREALRGNRVNTATSCQMGTVVVSAKPCQNPPYAAHLNSRPNVDATGAKKTSRSNER